jgi:hypothetical protein
MLENSDKNRETDPTLLSSVTSPADQLEQLQLDTFNLIKSHMLWCPKCSSPSLFGSEGMGGADGVLGARALQIKCKHSTCLKKTVFSVILKSSASTGDAPASYMPHATLCTAYSEFLAEQHRIKTQYKPKKPTSKSASSPRSASVPPSSRLEHSKFNPIVSAFRSVNTSPNTPSPASKSTKRAAESPADNTETPKKHASSLVLKSPATNDPQSPPAPPPHVQELQAMLIEEKRKNQQLQAEVAGLKKALAEIKTAVARSQANEDRINRLEALFKTRQEPPAAQQPQHAPRAESSQDAFPGLQAVPSRPRQPVVGHNPVPKVPRGRSKGDARPQSDSHQSMAQVRPVPKPSGEQINKPAFSAILKRPAPIKASAATIRTRKMALACLSPPAPPAIYRKLQFRLFSGLRLEKNASINVALRSILGGLKIKSAKAVSKIGNSILEIYYLEADHDDIVNKLVASGLTVMEDISNATPEFAAGVQGRDYEAVKGKVIGRLSILYRNTISKALRACILQGHSDDIQAEVIRRTNSPATLRVPTQADAMSDISSDLEVTPTSASPPITALSSQDETTNPNPSSTNQSGGLLQC